MAMYRQCTHTYDRRCTTHALARGWSAFSWTSKPGPQAPPICSQTPVKSGLFFSLGPKYVASPPLATRGHGHAHTEGDRACWCHFCGYSRAYLVEHTLPFVAHVVCVHSPATSAATPAFTPALLLPSPPPSLVSELLTSIGVGTCKCKQNQGRELLFVGATVFFTRQAESGSRVATC